ncbi:methyl-accepting chemotaxis protein [Saccharospirillum mangrovi]|uniref:methyl-accepting chemotaxis protein n=1 Tax=Saccharospirillum mangrovi TaxID=2161747 RepID=UPI000D337E0E|nr:methyl-accepting chemotaxis protein [Saccharospirillum mangrovi]
MIKNLSFRMKLTLLVVSALLGLAILYGVALQSLNQQQRSSEQLEQLNQTSTELDAYILEALRLRVRLYSLNDDNLDALQADLQAARERMGESDSAEQSDAAAAGMAAVLNHDRAYLDATLAYLQQAQWLGLTLESGFNAEVRQQGETLSETVGFLSFVQDQIEKIRSEEVIYLSRPSEQGYQQLKESLATYIGFLSDYGLAERFEDLNTRYIELIDEHRVGSRQLESDQAAMSEALAAMDLQQQSVRAELDQRIQQARTVSRHGAVRAQLLLALVSVGIGLFMLALVTGITRNVRQLLKGIISDLNKVKEGDLSARLSVNQKRNDEFDQLSSQVNASTEGLGALVQAVSESASSSTGMMRDLIGETRSLERSNEQINDQGQSVATSTEEISATLSDVADTTRTLSTQVRQTLQSARTGSQTLNQAVTSLRETGQVVGQIDMKLQELNERSTDIDNIVEMINGLAEQTNLLALNAAIESARAGDAGRGFSVVADEVRKLAEQTVDATSRIDAIVSDIQGFTRQAVEVTETGRHHLEAVEQHSSAAVQAMQAIEADAQQGVSAADQMAQAIEEVDKAAQGISRDMESVASHLRNDNQSLQRVRAQVEAVAKRLEELDQQTRRFRT